MLRHCEIEADYEKDIQKRYILFIVLSVESILGQMQAELAAAGQSTAPVGQLRSQYQNAKASQKAAYLAMARGA